MEFNREQGYILKIHKLINDKFVEICNVIDYVEWTYAEKIDDFNTCELSILPYDMRNSKNNDFLNEMFNEDFNIKDNQYIIEDPYDKQFFLITKTEQKFSSSAKDTKFVFVGTSLEFILSSRIVAPAPFIDGQGNYYFNKYYFYALANKVIKDFISGEEASARKGTSKINNYKILNCVDDSIDTSALFVKDNIYSKSYRFKNGLEILNDLRITAKVLSTEVKFFSRLINGKIKFYMKDCALKEEVKFNNYTFGNLKEMTVTYEPYENYNAYFVAGQGEGAARQTVYKANAYPFEQDGSNLKYNEVYVNASDVEQGQTDILHQKGKDAVNEAWKNVLIQSETNEIMNNQYILNKDYELGDVVKTAGEFYLEYVDVEELKPKKVSYKQESLQPIKEIGVSVVKQSKKIDITLGDTIKVISNKENQKNKNDEVNSRL